MNTHPNDTQLALWLDDELHGEELAAFEAGPGSLPAQQAAREEIRHWRARMATEIPVSEEPPYPEFFNSRVMQALSMPVAESVVIAGRRFAWRSWFMPLAACAGMVLAFVVGLQSGTRTTALSVINPPKAIIIEPAVYTPESGVIAESFTSASASATVIVLNGVAAIPDTIDFTQASAQLEGDSNEATAELDPELSDIPGL